MSLDHRDDNDAADSKRGDQGRASGDLGWTAFDLLAEDQDGFSAPSSDVRSMVAERVRALVNDPSLLKQKDEVCKLFYDRSLFRL